MGSVNLQPCIIRANRTAGVLATASNAAISRSSPPASIFQQQRPGRRRRRRRQCGRRLHHGDNYQTAASTTCRAAVSGWRRLPAPRRRIHCSERPSPATHSRARSSAGPGIAALLSSTTGQAAPARLRFSSNSISQYSLQPGIAVTTPHAGTSPLVHVTIENNHVDMREVPVCQRAPADRRESGCRRHAGGQRLRERPANSSHW